MLYNYSTTDDDRIRIERMENKHFEYSQALEIISAFYSEGDGKEKAASGKLNHGNNNVTLSSCLHLF